MERLEFISWSVIALTASGHSPPRSSLPRPFPGPIVPGPAHTEQYIGPSAIEIFDYLLTIPERVVNPSHIIFDEFTGEYCYDASLPDLEFTPIPKLDDWIWDVSQPILTQMQLSKPSLFLTKTSPGVRRYIRIIDKGVCQYRFS